MIEAIVITILAVSNIISGVALYRIRKQANYMKEMINEWND